MWQKRYMSENTEKSVRINFGRVSEARKAKERKSQRIKCWRFEMLQKMGDTWPWKCESPRDRLQKETKPVWYVIVTRMSIESAIFLGSERGSFRKYNRHTLRGAALIDKFGSRGRSEAKLFEAEKINASVLKQGCEMVWWKWATCLGGPHSAESLDCGPLT